MEEQKLYSVILSEKEFGLLSWLDRKWTNFKNWRNKMTARANNAFVNFLGLGNTRVGRGLKGLNNARADIRNRMNEAGYNLRGSILGYKEQPEQESDMEERQYSRDDYKDLPKSVEKQVRKRRNDLAKQLREDRKYLNSEEFKNSVIGKKTITSKKSIDLGDWFESGYNVTSKRKPSESDADFLGRHKKKIIKERTEATEILKDAIKKDSEQYKTRTKKTQPSIMKKTEKWISKHPVKSSLIGAGVGTAVAGGIYTHKKLKDRKENMLRDKFDHLSDSQILGEL